MSLIEQQHDESATAAVFLDALPYVDQVDETYDALAQSLVEEEMQTMQKDVQINDDDIKPIKYTTKLFEQEYNQRSRRLGPLPELFSHDKRSIEMDLHTLEDYQDAVKRARTAYEKERLREVQLSVDKTESSSLWKLQADNATRQLQSSEQRLEHQRHIVERINALRLQEQEGFGRELERASRQFQELIDKRMQLQQAIAQLEDELSTDKRSAADAVVNNS
ncbi:hypothetical protein MPSEU_000181700 [Mayamaea pseudoterrestris]|nr:hypothetical protein MPSEU_000181700 [Mayamaea pseudoterrestris]